MCQHGCKWISVAGLELSCASNESFLSRDIRQTNLYADISKLLQLLGSMGCAPALVRELSLHPRAAVG